MKRRDFFTNSSLALLGTSLITPSGVSARPIQIRKERTAKNIIFMVSDGMSTGTLNMASLLSQRKLGRQTSWIKLYEENKGRRALMDTSSSNALVTDSAAGSSAWGGGVKVPNGSLNVNETEVLTNRFSRNSRMPVKLLAVLPRFPLHMQHRQDFASIINRVEMNTK